MNKVICNIPHASVVIPQWAMEDILISTEELHKLADFMADKDMDKMWGFVPPQNKMVATVSRLIVDIERFEDDTKELMAQKGMGLYYTYTPDGKPFRRKTDSSYRKAHALYLAYHKELEEKVGTCLKKYGTCILLDCHSFHDQMTYTETPTTSFPDVCIGVNGETSPEAEIIMGYFQQKGYSVSINEPFAGSLVPLKYGNDPRVLSVMIELNRRIYDNNAFSKVQRICKEIFVTLNN